MVTWRGRLGKFQSHLNAQCDSIKFTLKKKEESSLPFLDVLITKNLDGSLSHQVYRNKTHTDKYLHADSHHHPSHKIGIINTLETRAWRVSDTDHVKGELDHIKTTLINNGYNGKEVDKVFHNVKKRRHKTKKRNTTLPRITLPYIHGTTNKIANILKKKNIWVAFTPPNSVRTLLDKAKDPVDP